MQQSNVVSLGRQTDILIREIERLFSEAEAAIKDGEIEYNEHPNPPVNELRYAARHMLDGLLADHQRKFEKRDEQFDKAKRHCLRAIYDAKEIGLLSNYHKLQGYIKQYNITIIEKYVKDYSEVRALLRDVQDSLKKISATKDVDGVENKRHEFVNWCSEMADKLKKRVREFEDYEKNFLEDYQKERKTGKLASITFYIGIIALILSLLNSEFGFIDYIQQHLSR